LIDLNHFISDKTKKSYAILKLSVICMTNYWYSYPFHLLRRQKRLTTTQVI